MSDTSVYRDVNGFPRFLDRFHCPRTAWVREHRLPGNRFLRVLSYDSLMIDFATHAPDSVPRE